jgi:phosphohistidine swiveling domain-containing protein
MSFIKSLAELGQADLLLAGGKAANLGVLIRAGLPVPPGFCVTTDAYRAFVAANSLEAPILRLTSSLPIDDPSSLDDIAEQIRVLFSSGQIPDDLAAEIRSAYAALARQQPTEQPTDEDQPLAVAVRSSATAEDLPDMSFAGQQDTYLNVVGEAALLQAVVRCWGSLWTARAIGYRARNGIPSQGIALAVVVQVMVPSEVSGVLFTANSLTGRRTETVIEATLGLGEALVSGQVEPDQYLFDAASRRILNKKLGAKALSIRGQRDGGTLTVTETAADRQALPDDRILELARLGRRAAQVFNAPQDIEWAWAAGKLYLVQSRPITSLYPLPADLTTGSAEGDVPFSVLFSYGVWQGMLDPYTPLGQDLFRGLQQGIARALGLTLPAKARIFVAAGERLFLDITGMFRRTFGRLILRTFVGAIDPVTGEALESLWDDPRLSIRASRMRIGTLLRLVRRLAPLIANILYCQITPSRGRARVQRRIDAVVSAVSARSARTTTLAEQVALFDETLAQQPLALLPYLLAGIISGQMAQQMLIRLAAGLPDGLQIALELTRALPHNPTTEMDLSLWAAARTIRDDRVAAKHFAQADPATLATEYLAGALPATAQATVTAFMAQYGMRGIGEIDLGRPRWREEPAHIMQILKNYLLVEDEATSPEAVFQRGADRAQAAQEQLIDALRQTPRGRLKAFLARRLARRARELGGLRESPKFAIIRLFGVLREMLLGRGRQLVAAGVLTQADDVFFLHLPELRALAAGDWRDWRSLVAERRQAYDREKRRPRSPRLLFSDGTAFYERAQKPEQSGADIIVGSPVSAGIAEGTVHVVLDPHGTRLTPGEILVCPATDPAWTPLFLTAGGLVTEVGGMVSHGSVVAREYGIPAVVGVAQATARLKTGQHIRIDGSTGQIVILEAADTGRITNNGHDRL